MSGLSLSAPMTLGLGANRSAGGGVVTPWYANAVEIDLINTRFAADNTTYATEAELLTYLTGGDARAVGTVVGVVHTIGNYCSPGNTEMISDGDFPDGSTEWAANGSGASYVATSGEGQLSGGGATNPSLYQLVGVQKGHAYRLVGKVRRGTDSVTGPKIVAGSTASLGAAASQSTQAAGSSFTEFERNFATISSLSEMYVGMVSQGSGVAGFNAADDFSCKEVWPFLGYGIGSVSGKIRATVPADTTGTTILAQYYAYETNGSINTPYERNFVRIAVISGNLRLVVNCHTAMGTTTQQVSLNAGAVTAGQQITVEFCAIETLGAIRLDNGTAVTGTITNMPGLTHLRLHAPQPGSSLKNWDNDDTWFTHYTEFTPPTGVSVGQRAVEGDSYASGLKVYLGTVSGKAIVGSPIGGSTLQQVHDRYVNYSASLRSQPCVILDGITNGHGTLAADLALYAAMETACTNSAFLVMGPVNIASSISTHTTDLQAALATAYGANYLDLQAALAAANDGSAGDLDDVAAGVVPRSLMDPDDTHLNAEGLTIAANLANDRFVALGV